MPQFVSDGERRAQAVILDDGTARHRLADLAELRQPQGVARLRVATEVFARYQDGDVMVMRMALVRMIVAILPVAEVSKRFRCRWINKISSLCRAQGGKRKSDKRAKT